MKAFFAKLWAQMIAHKVISIAVAAVLVAGTACAVVLPVALQHKHTFGDEWVVSDTEHWHACTDEDCAEKVDVGAHQYDNGADTTCNICGYERPAHIHQASTAWSKDGTNHWHVCSVDGCSEQLDKAAHTYDNDADNTCNICDYERPAHTHRASAEWSSDETNHWHVCTVDGCEETLDTAAHVYDREVVAEEYFASEATYTQAAKYFKSCVCGKKGTETFDAGSALEAKENQVLLADGTTLGKTYDGAAYTLSADKFTANGDGAMTFAYKGADETEWSASAPVNAGSYEVRVSVAATAEWKAAQATFNFTIAKKQLTISGTTVLDKEYDGTTDATVMPGTLAGLVSGDEAFVGVTATGTFASKDVAYELDVDPQDVTISYALTGTLANNYIVPDGETMQAKINPKPLSNVHLTKVYDGHGRFDRQALTTAQGIVEGESIKIYVDAISGNVGTYKDGNEDANFDLNEYVLYIGDSEEQTINYAWGDTCTATITAKQLTISGTTVSDKEYDGTTDATVMPGTLAGLIGSDELSVGATATGTFADKDAAADKSVTIVYSLTGTLAKNYLAPENGTATATINKKELTLTEIPSMEYNGDNRIQKVTSEGCAEGESVVVMYFLDGADAGTRTVTNCSFVLGYQNYSINSFSTTATITQKAITELNIALTPQTGTSVSISVEVELGRGMAESVDFKLTVISESEWNHAGELVLVLEKPITGQAKIEIVSDTNYKLAYNLVGNLTIAVSES